MQIQIHDEPCTYLFHRLTNFCFFLNKESTIQLTKSFLARAVRKLKLIKVHNHPYFSNSKLNTRKSLLLKSQNSDKDVFLSNNCRFLQVVAGIFSILYFNLSSKNEDMIHDLSATTFFHPKLVKNLIAVSFYDLEGYPSVLNIDYFYL